MILGFRNRNFVQLSNAMIAAASTGGTGDFLIQQSVAALKLE